MAYQRFYDTTITSSDFPFTTSTFLDWFANQSSKFYSIGLTVGGDSPFSEAVDSGETITLYQNGSQVDLTIYQLIKKDTNYFVNPHFYFFATNDGITKFQEEDMYDFDSYYIKNESDNPVMPQWLFEDANKTYLYAIKLSNKYYLIAREKTQRVNVWTYLSTTNPVPSSFDPLQTVTFTTTPKSTFSYKPVSFNSNIKTNGMSRSENHSYTFSSSYDTSGTKTASITVGGQTYSVTITINDWANKLYSIEATGSSSSFKIYSGKVVGSDFLNAYRIKYRRWNAYGEVVTYPKASLELNKMSKTVLSESDSTFDFDYDITDISENSQTSLSLSVSSSLHKLATSETIRWQAVQCQTIYSNGDIIENVDLSTVGSLTYDDGTTISLQNVAFLSQSKTCSAGNLPYTVNIDTPNPFTITYIMNTQYFGALAKTFSCSLDSSISVASVILHGAKTNFLPNENIDFGNDAQLRLYNSENTLLKVVARGDFNQYISNVDSKIGTSASNYMRDGDQTYSFVACGYQITHTFTVTYDKVSLILDTTFVKLEYYIKQGDFDGFDYDGLVVKRETHTNAVGQTPVVTQTTLTSQDYSITSPTIDYTQKTTYKIVVSRTNTSAQGGQVLTGTFNVVGEPVKAVKIVCSGDPQYYYDNNAELFRLPSNMTYTIVYNDVTENHTVTAQSLHFFRNADLANELTLGESLVTSNNGGSAIYVYSEEYNVVGFYPIQWQTDSIVSVALANEVTAYFGNRLNKIKPSVSFNCLRISGRTTVLSDVNSFDFTDTSIILETPDTIDVIVNGEGTFELTNPENITFVAPTPIITINSNNFQKTYNNKVDVIDPSTLVVTVNYMGGSSMCDYAVACTYSSTSTSAYNKFTVSGLGDLENYDFVSAVDITMSDASVDEQIRVTCIDTFSDEEITADVDLTLIEILDITGIKLLNAKTEFNVGDEFLIDDDVTRVMVFYKDTNNQSKTYTFKLSNALTALNIYPVKGTKFNNIATNKQVTISSATNYNVNVQYMINVRANFSQNETTIHDLVALYIDSYVCPDGVSRSKYFLVPRYRDVNGENVENTRINNMGERVIANGLSVEELEVFGYLEDIFDSTMNARVILFKDYSPTIEGSNNITVKFPCYVEGNADLINKCHFGIMFGNNNAKNRLFLSGNPDFSNKDWHSSQVDSSYTDDETMLTGNYGYFEDTSVCVYGETDNKVVGYDIVSNDKLFVLKSKSDKETTIYFRQPQLVTAINNSGTAVTGLNDETLYQEEFSLAKGNNSVAGVSPKTIINFNGDTLFMSSDKQVCGLDLTGIVGDNQRYANTRSYYIDEDLRKQDIDGAFMWTNNKYLFVVLKNKVYVTHFELKGETQYEWFVLDLKDITSLFEKDGVIYLGNSQGEVFKFSDVFEDTYKMFVGYGEARLSINEQTEVIISSDSLEEIDETSTYYFKPIPLTEVDGDYSYIYYSLGDITNVSGGDGDFYVNNADNRNVFKLVAIVNGVEDEDRKDLLLKRINETTPVFLNKQTTYDSVIACKSGSVFEDAWGKPYYIREYVDLNEEHLYQLVDENENVMPVKELYRARLCLKLTESKQMTDIDVENGTFKLLSEGEIIDIVQYNQQVLATAFKGEIIQHSNVEAYYVTKPYTMGSVENFKTIWSFTLTNDTNVPSELELCCVSNKIPSEKFKTLGVAEDDLTNVSKDKLGFGFDEFDFTKVDFDKNITPRTYTYKRIISSVKFLCFGFKNFKNSNAVLSSMTVTYTLPYPSYGGD